MPDHVVLDYATRLGRAVLTLNWDDFLSLHDRGVAHAGIVACEADDDPDALAARTDAALGARPTLAGQFVQVRR